MKFIAFILVSLCLSINGKAYWQQHTATKIKVKLNDQNHGLSGYEEIIYTNNSPDSLTYIYMHLWPNAYKNDQSQFAKQLLQNGKTDFYYSGSKDKGYIDSLQFQIDGTDVTYAYEEGQLDIIRIELAHPLAPNSSIKITTPFFVKIPKIFSRLGHTGQAYFISQWFPKPAVYDATGWHPMSYCDQGEFYSDFGSYDVRIELPRNYIVLATGICTDTEEIDWLNHLAQKAKPSDTLYQRSYPESDSVFKTVRFIADKVHDFAWFADKRWIVDHDSIQGANNLGTTQMYTAYLPEHQKEWHGACNVIKATINYYGATVGAYPYPTVQAVEGDMIAGGGMEYPSITIIDKAASSALEQVLIHEVGHNWFYGILGSNERMHPWMDEGINSFYELKTFMQISKSSKKRMFISRDDIVYYELASIRQDAPIEQPANKYTNINYGADVYYKTSLMLEWLEQYMGEQAFSKGIKAYFKEWEFKHPQPLDFKKCMQEQTSKNLNWFFEEALFATRPVDFAFKKAKHKNGAWLLTIQNKSTFKAPTEISLINEGKTTQHIDIEPFMGTTTYRMPDTTSWQKAQLSSSFAEYRLNNNNYYRSKTFPTKSWVLHKGIGLNRNEHNNLYILSAMGYNAYDGFGLGLLIHNISVPENRLQFAFAPQFGCTSKHINGVGAISYSWYPQKLFQEIRVQTNIKSYSQASSDLNIDHTLYARYLKIAPSISLTFKNKQALSKKSNQLTLTEYNISENDFVYTQNSSIDSLYRPSLVQTQHTYLKLFFEHKNNRTLYPYSYSAKAEMGASFIKLGLEGKFKINYDAPKKAMYIRVYAGKFISTDNTADNSRYCLNTQYSGANDYLYEGTYIGRNKTEGIGSQQIAIQEGGFKTPTLLYANQLGRTNNWLMSINAKTDLPFKKVPIRLYADIGAFANAKNINPYHRAICINTGLEIHLLKETINIYLPLLSDKGYSDYLKQMYPQNKLLHSLSFSLNIQNFNFLRTQEKIFELIAH